MMQLEQWHQIRLQDIPPSPWRNGGGTTQEVVCWPTPSNWVWRMSVAQVASDGPFSEFKGVERWFAVLSGNGVALEFPGRREVLGALDPVLHFSGQTPCMCSLTNGPTVDFNLMTQGVLADMKRIHCVDFERNFPAHRTMAIYVIEAGGHIMIDQQPHALVAESLYWARLERDTHVALHGVHALLIQLETNQ